MIITYYGRDWGQLPVKSADILQCYHSFDISRRNQWQCHENNIAVFSGQEVKRCYIFFHRRKLPLNIGKTRGLLKKKKKKRKEKEKMPPGDRTLKEYSISNSSFFTAKKCIIRTNYLYYTKSIGDRHFKTHILRHTGKWHYYSYHRRTAWNNDSLLSHFP